MSNTLELNLFWSFRSPWSYLATPCVRRWQDEYQLRINFRPVYPIALRPSEFFHRVNPQWFSYFMTVVYRVADYLELLFTWPNPDPVAQFVDDQGCTVDWHQGDHLALATERAGLSLVSLDAAIVTEEQQTESVIASNEQAGLQER